MSDTPHSVDDQVVYSGQLYKLARTEPYTRRDTATTVSTWRSHCASCGVSFELRRTPTARQSSGGERILRLSAALTAPTGQDRLQDIRKGNQHEPA